MVSFISPSVSICIPAYKQPGYLRRALKSVLIQNYKDYEIVITDDSPDDSVQAIVGEFLPNPRIRYHKNPVRFGSPRNWNAAISLSRGEYVKILHHDDWLTAENSLRRFLDLLEAKPAAVLGFSATSVCDAEIRVARIHRPTDKQLALLKEQSECLFPENFIGGPSATIFRRKGSAIFDEKLKWVVDVEFYARVLRGSNAFSYCDHPLVATTNGAPHQVTQECLGNRSVELFEWTYWYQSLFRDRFPAWGQLHFMWQLYCRYSATSIGDLLHTGVKPPIPVSLRVLLALCRTRLPMVRFADALLFRRHSTRG